MLSPDAILDRKPGSTAVNLCRAKTSALDEILLSLDGPVSLMDRSDV